MKTLKVLTGIFVMLVGVSAAAQNTRIPNFNNSKKILKRFELFSRETLYCGCKIVNENKVDMASCGYVPPSESKRAGKVEWEHVVAASALSQGIPYNKSVCGKKDKRKCLEDTNPDYAYRTADLYNLYAEDGYTNLLRSDKPHEELTSSDKSFGKCDMKIGKHGFTPRPQSKGIVGRTYLYMNSAYPGAQIAKKNLKLYQAWSNMFPVTQTECARAKFIENIQKNANEFVKAPCSAKGWY